MADYYLKKTLLDLQQTATINDSLRLGRSVLSELGEINTLHKAEVEQAGFAVLKAPDIPSILVETAFITNPEEEARLKSAVYQEKIADAVVARDQALLRPQSAGRAPAAHGRRTLRRIAQGLTRSASPVDALLARGTISAP